MPVHFHADDLGLHPAVDRAIFRAHEVGAIAGASLLVTGPTFRQAAVEARARGLPTGLHLALVDTAPVSPPADVASLIGSDGRFPPYFGRVTLRYLLGRLRRDQIRLEVGRQLERFAEAGLIGAGGLLLDGHQHLHLLPAVLDSVVELGRSWGLRKIRLPYRSPDERRRRNARAAGFALADLLSARAARQLRRAGLATVPCWGVVYAGHLTVAAARSVLASLPPDAEGQLICHPGDDDRALAGVRNWGYRWETELATVLQLGPGRAGSADRA
jgi:predicted glycoside hydrolase/deacetylase ChbG (UPF0249 family)